MFHENLPTMRYLSFDKQQDNVLLIARVLMMVLFVMFGWQKLIGFSGTVAYMGSTGVAVPTLAAVIAVVMEFVAGLLIVAGFYTRPVALLLALYTLGTAFIGHPYWTMTGADQYANQINFYKNVSIVGGLLVLIVSGPGRFSIDRH
ncbi:DoxX family protein [Burkholderia sp. AU30280]|uniref:DoxX family protein n=1 Tax=Burkholderia sp. AU30280 TaxID=2879628 RepID=UPI00299D9F91|nr:DoxX family protein [Burkholderia sp. AU30280]